MVDTKKIYNLFDRFSDQTDSFPGAMFVSIYNDFPICYCFQFGNTDKIRYSPYLDKPLNKKIKHNINVKIMLKAFYESNNYTVIQYSSYEYLILGNNYNLLTIITLSDTTERTETLYQNIYISAKYTNEDIKNICKEINSFFSPVKREEQIEFGIAAIAGSGDIYTNYYDFKTINVDIDANYNDDIPYDRMVEILNDETSASLLLFYGEPGTGKSSIIKKFISEMPEKEFIFMDGTLLANVQQDRLMAYFLENENSIFIFEDCEKILLDRDHNYNPTMSILLNLTDGIISDVLNIKIICTFNTNINNIDTALLRKGRLSLKYEFTKLAKEKVRKILNDNTIDKDMTLADIYYYKEENDFSKKKKNKMGF